MVLNTSVNLVRLSAFASAIFVSYQVIVIRDGNDNSSSGGELVERGLMVASDGGEDDAHEGYYIVREVRQASCDL